MPTPNSSSPASPTEQKVKEFLVAIPFANLERAKMVLHQWQNNNGMSGYVMTFAEDCNHVEVVYKTEGRKKQRYPYGLVLVTTGFPPGGDGTQIGCELYMFYEDSYWRTGSDQLPPNTDLMDLPQFENRDNLYRETGLGASRDSYWRLNERGQREEYSPNTNQRQVYLRVAQPARPTNPAPSNQIPINRDGRPLPTIAVLDRTEHGTMWLERRDWVFYRIDGGETTRDEQVQANMFRDAEDLYNYCLPFSIILNTDQVYSRQNRVPTMRLRGGIPTMEVALDVSEEDSGN